MIECEKKGEFFLFNVLESISTQQTDQFIIRMVTKYYIITIIFRELLKYDNLLK